MTIKLLLPAYGKHGTSVVAIDGELRVIDRPVRVCHGYQTGCCCEECLERAKAEHEEPVVVEVKRCECDRPIVLADATECFRCGRPEAIAAAA